MLEKGRGVVVIVAGEVSGDMYGGMVLAEMRRVAPDLDFVGIGGDRMAEAGVELLCHVKETAVMGLVEMGDKIIFLYRKYREIVNILDQGRVLGVVLIDYPDFNLRVAVSAKMRGIPVFYYISPQLWAWRKWRIRTIRRCVSRMIVILPFEKKFYEKNGVSSEFFGHPLIDLIKCRSRNDIREEFGLADRWPVIALLPGSREKEVLSLFPEMLRAAKKIKELYPSALFLLPVADSLSPDFLRRFISNSGIPVLSVTGRNHDVMRASDLLVTKSGTSTLEAAIIGTPMVIVYRASFISIMLARLLVKVQFAGLPNLLAGRRVAVELLQKEMTCANIVKEVKYILDNKAAYDKQVTELGKIAASLGEPGASRRVAKEIISELRKHVLRDDRFPGLFRQGIKK